MSSPYLDSLSPAPRAVFSLRKLISTASNCLRVRRSSDSTEMDIGFAGRLIDTTTLLSFVGAGSGFVVTWYDQTGNGEDATQATAANQPRIVNSGVYDEKVIWDGTNDSLKITSLTQGSAYFAVYGLMQHAVATTNKIFLESSTNYNSNTQGFTFYVGPDVGLRVWSLNMNNGAGSQRFNQYVMPDLNALVQFSALWDRTLTGTSELKFYVEGDVQTKTSNASATVEQTGTFSAYDVYIGARAGTSLFSAMQAETLVLYNSDTSSIRTSIDSRIGHGTWTWKTRLNAPTTIRKFDQTYFIVDCWHSRLIYSTNVYLPIADWNVMIEHGPRGPHSIAYDGYMYVTESTDAGDKLYTFKSDGAGGYTNITNFAVGTGLERPHRTQYDSNTGAFYTLLGGQSGDGLTRKMVKLTRSGDTLTAVNTTSLTGLAAGYARGFCIIGTKMYIVAEPGKVFEYSFNSTPTYTLDATYNLPTGFESPNDVFQDASGNWWVTATSNKILKGTSLAAIHAGTYTNMYATIGLTGTPYYLTEFDGALWIPQIIDSNGIVKYEGGVTEFIHDYGPENSDSLDRHNDSTP